MQPTLHAHPFSSYCQKALIALYENETQFEFSLLDFGDPETGKRFEALWPLQRMPVLVDAGRTIMESSVIIEYLDQRYPGPTRFIPEDPQAALDARMMDRIFDCYVMTPMQKIVFDCIRAEPDRDPYGVAEARRMLDKTYGWLDNALAGKEWAVGGTFSLADCAAAPSLFFADWVHDFPARYAHLREYRARLLARPSVALAVDKARPYRRFFPPGAPDRD